MQILQNGCHLSGGSDFRPQVSRAVGNHAGGKPQFKTELRGKPQFKTELRGKPQFKTELEKLRKI